MSLLVLQLPPPPRLHPGHGEQPVLDATASVAELSYVTSSDGQRIGDSGHCAPALLPARGSGAHVVAVLADSATSWQRITCPKAPATRLRAALLGVLEEELLDETAAVHLALEPGATAGEPAWVAITDRAWLNGQLQALEQAGIHVDQIVPGAQPADGVNVPLTLHASTATEAGEPMRGDTSDQGLRLTWSHVRGVTHWRAEGSLARQWLPQPLPGDLQLSATPAAAAAAQSWLGVPPPIVPTAEHLLRRAASGWNLRQFELAPRHRGVALLRDARRELSGPGWRWARFGLIGLVLVQLIGLNTAAWMQKSQLQARRDAMTTLLRSTHPQVRAILDAPLQMQRETESLRAAAGKAGDTDLETLLQVAASGWPAGLPLQGLRFEPGKLTLQAPNLDATDITRLREQLQPGGWQIEGSGDQLTLRPRPAGAPPRPTAAGPRPDGPPPPPRS